MFLWNLTVVCITDIWWERTASYIEKVLQVESKDKGNRGGGGLPQETRKDEFQHGYDMTPKCFPGKFTLKKKGK